MDIQAARKILDAAVPVWLDDSPDWEDVLSHESVRGFHALLVHAIEQRGWEDPLDAVFDLLGVPQPRPEERLLTEALAVWAESAGGPIVPPPPEAPGALRAWARVQGIEELLDRRMKDVDPHLGEESKDQTLGDVYRAAAISGGGRGRTPARPKWVAERILEMLHDAAIARVQRAGMEQRLRDLETRVWSPTVSRLFGQLTELARELEESTPIAGEPTPMMFFDDPPRFVPTRYAGIDRSSVDTSVSIEDGLSPVLRNAIRPGEALALVDGARLSLADPEVAEHVEQVLSQPTWKRMVDGLERALAGLDARRDPAMRLEWRIDTDERGELVLDVYLQKQKKDGKWTSGRRLHRADVDAHARTARTHAERIAVALYERAFTVRPNERFGDLLELLEDARLVHARSGAPVHVRRTAPRLAFETVGDALVPRVRVGGILMAPRDVRERLRMGHLFVLEEGPSPTVWLATLDEGQRAIVESLAARAAHVPADSEARAALVKQLPGIAHRMDLDLPEELRGRMVPGDRRLLVRLDLVRSELRVWLGARLLPGTSMLRPGEGPPVVVSFVEGVAVHARRDFDRERALEAEEIGRLGLAPYRHSDGSFCVSDLDVALSIVEAVQGRADELQIEWAHEKKPRVRALAPSELELRVERKRDWWGIAGGADTELGRVDLAALLEAAREGREYVQVGPGAFARIEASLRKRLLAADSHIRDEHGGHVFRATALEAISDLATDTTFDGGRAFFELVEKVKRARETEPVLDAPIAKVLRPYQRSGFEWLARLGAWGVGGVLADDMGLGKTLQALALLSFRASEGPALVVAPTSVVGNWVREAERFSPDLRVRAHRGSVKERAVGEPEAGEVLVTSYDIAVRDAKELSAVRFGTVILDEAQLVKNPATRRARTMRDLSAELKIALTGTPIENHLGELWSIFRIVCPELLGSFESFRGRFALPIERDGNALRREQLADLLRPFVLRRTKREVAPELPPRTEMVHEVELTEEERALYDRERALAIASTTSRGADARFALLAALTKLRELACDARLLHESWKGPTSKIDELVRLVTELKDEGHRVLVFSAFRRLLGLARDALAAQGVVCLELTGETPALERERRVERFQAGGADAFLISLKAGGTGLNLTAATYVVHLDPWWNPAAEDQATDRAHRIGQTEPVTVYRLVSTGTIEQAVIALHDEKRALADGILAGKDAAASLGAEDLAALLRHGW